MTNLSFENANCMITSQYISSMMIHRIVTIVLLASIFTISQEQKAGKRPARNDVIELQPTNFQETVYASDDPWLLYLYAPWCDPCKELHPEFAKVATRLKDKVKVAKIDPSNNEHRPKFHKLYGLVGFPRIILLPAGPKDDQAIYDVFDGARDAASITQWALERVKIHKAQALDRIISQQVWEESCIETGSSVCIVTLLPSLLDSSEQQRTVYLQIVRSVINNYRDKPLSFLWTVAGDHSDFEDLFDLRSGFPAVVLVNPQRGVFTTMKGSLTEENMEEWLEDVFKPKGNRRLSKFSSQITFNTISEQSKQEQEGVQINEEL